MPHGKQTKAVATERVFRMYMDAIRQNPEQIIRESKSPFMKEINMKYVLEEVYKEENINLMTLI